MTPILNHSNRPKTACQIILPFVLFFCLTSEIQAMIFCVNNAAELQSALTTAETNAEHDTIKVVQGTYLGNFWHFSDNLSTPKDISLEGGYFPGCASRHIDPMNTLLVGDQTTHPLYISTYPSGDVKVEGFTIQNGNAYEGGGLYIFCESETGTAGAISVLKNLVLENTANNRGGGIFAESRSASGTAGTILVEGNKVTGNNLTYEGSQGGGINIISLSTTGSASDVTLSNNVIMDNNATTAAGAYAASVSSEGTAGNVTYVNNTIVENTARGGSGGVVLSGSNNINNFYNNIVWGNTNTSGSNGGLIDIDFSGSGTFNGYNNNYFALIGGSWTNSADNNASPCLFYSGDYQLESSSFCVDAGNNSAPQLSSVDCEGDPRIVNGTAIATAVVDIGADEFIEIILGDLDNNGSADLKDCILSLQVVSGLRVPQTLKKYNSVRQNRQIGLADSIYSLREEAGLNP